MKRLDLEFGQIRALGGSRNHAFEELCAQLASLEPCAGDAIFHRKGPGADAGVECYLCHADNKETGWQAKYFFEFGASQIAQLDESIAQALAKHPRLNQYIVCLPINLRDARVGKAHSELQRWQAWVSKWKAAALKQKRTLAIDLWSKSSLFERLGRDDPLYSGRVAFWFDETILTSAWFDERFLRARANLGERYTPESNVELPIRRTILAFCRDPSSYDEIERWGEKIEEARHRVLNDLKRITPTPELSSDIAELEKTMGRLAGLLSVEWRDPTYSFPLESLGTSAGQSLSALGRLWRRFWEIREPDKQNQDDLRHLDYSLRKLDDLLSEIADALTSDRWVAVNGRRLLMTGQAGVGKSHLFGDAADYQLSKGKPALLILGGSLIDDEPWVQLIKQLGISLDVDTFLGALDAAAEATASRAVIFVDAINERHGIDLWAHRLPGFLAAIERFPRVAVALSCRTTYRPYVFPSGVGSGLLEIEHRGFAGHASEAARYYLDKRGIVRMSAPGLVPEFENPLFLKTCCDALAKEGLHEIPRGLRGVTEIFGFYAGAVAKQINSRLKLDPKRLLVPRALEALADAFDTDERGYIGYEQAAQIVEGILPSLGQFERSLLVQLISEGILADEPVEDNNGNVVQNVRFTFERFSDHRIARRLLDKHLGGAAKPRAAFAKGTYLNDYVTGRESYHHAGVIAAMAIQLPEQYGVELSDAIERSARYKSVFAVGLVESVLWRDQTSFSKRTLDLLRETSSQTGRDESLYALIVIATEPANKFNADFLHRQLMKSSLPERDMEWSTFISQAYDSEDSAIETLIDWTAQNGFDAMDDKRARLAAIALAWLFSSSHRQLRDRATKALATLLAPRLDLGAYLIDTFKDVNDPYVLDRVLAAAYGAALQGISEDGLAALAQVAFSCVFDRTIPIIHVLIRDHASGIIELASTRGVLLKGVKIAKIRPPYPCSGIIEDVPDAIIESYVQDYPSGYRGRDQIVGSVINDGDFARYIVDHVVRDFSALSLSLAGKTAKQVFESWAAKSIGSNAGLAVCFAEAKRASKELRNEQRVRKPPTFQLKFLEPGEIPNKSEPSAAEKKLDAAEARLCEALGEKGKAEYDTMARAFLRQGTSVFGQHYSWPPPFDTHLARRWICKRAHDFGWTPERFAVFDRQAGGDRHNHRMERIGKKYQWLAFHELVARLGDRQAFIGSYPRNGISEFQGGWQVHCRDIDPSLLASQTPADEWGPSEKTWWMPVDVVMKPVTPHARLAWLQDQQDLVRGTSLIEVIEPKTKRRWLVIDGFMHWNQGRMREGDRKQERDLWSNLDCLIVKKRDRARLLRALSGLAVSNRDLPELERASEGYIGEYPWHPIYKDLDPWVEPNSWSGIPVKTQPVVTEYLAERGGHDYSIEETFRVKLPAPGLIKGLGLHLSNGKQLSYSDDDGRLLFFDPSAKDRGRSAALVDREAFLSFLAREQLEAVWIVKGEKRAYGGGQHDRGYAGSQTWVSVYWRTAEDFQHTDKSALTKGSQDQLDEFFRDQEAEETARPSLTPKPRKRPMPKRTRGGVRKARKQAPKRTI